MRVLVTGGGGILGTALRRTRPESVDATFLRHADLDVTDRRRTLDAVARLRPDWIVHAAAWTAVDDCESDPERAWRVNWLGTANAADAAAAAGARMIVLSTDYVFDGSKRGPWVEHDEPRPLSVYGSSKRFAEREALLRGPRMHVVRTQWVFGAGGRNFVDTILRAARERPGLKVVSDQRGCPTWSRHLAAGLWRLIEADPGGGLWHLSAGGEASWFDLASAAVREAGLTTPVAPCSTADYPRPAARPLNGVLRNLRCELTIGDPMPPWEEGLRGYLRELRGEDPGSA